MGIGASTHVKEIKINQDDQKWDKYELFLNFEKFIKIFIFQIR